MEFVKTVQLVLIVYSVLHLILAYVFNVLQDIIFKIHNVKLVLLHVLVALQNIIVINAYLDTLC